MNGPALGKNITLTGVEQPGLVQEEHSTKGRSDIEVTFPKHSGLPIFWSSALEWFYSMAYSDILLNIYNHICSALLLVYTSLCTN